MLISVDGNNQDNITSMVPSSLSISADSLVSGFALILAVA